MKVPRTPFIYALLKHNAGIKFSAKTFIHQAFDISDDAQQGYTNRAKRISLRQILTSGE